MKNALRLKRQGALLACVVLLASVSPAIAQNNDAWQRQQRQQQDQMRQQQQQQRQQQQDQARQQQDQMRQQQRQQQDQMRQQQHQHQQQDQMRQQSQVRQPTTRQQQDQMREAQKVQMMSRSRAIGASPNDTNRTSDRTVFSNGVAKITRPLTSAEIKRGFTGKVTSDGRALIKFQNRIVTVPASRVGITRKTSTSQAALATRWSPQQQRAVKGDIQKLAVGNSSGLLGKAPLANAQMRVIEATAARSKQGVATSDGPIGGGAVKAGAKLADGVADVGAKGAADVTKRPSGFRKQTVQDAWDNAATGSKSGAKACPTCGKDVEVGPGQGRRDWDVDHQPKWKDRDLTGMERKQILDEYNKDVQLRCPGCNRSDN